MEFCQAKDYLTAGYWLHVTRDVRVNLQWTAHVLDALLIKYYFFLPQTENAIDLLDKFESISGSNLDINEKYTKVLMNYGRDLESIRKLYQKYKQEPMIPRNLPPVAGRIAWSRQLYRKIEEPMKAFKTKPIILKNGEAKKIVRNYNKMAGVLMEYEVNCWYTSIIILMFIFYF